jgi:hypothetical protein
VEEKKITHDPRSPKDAEGPPAELQVDCQKRTDEVSGKKSGQRQQEKITVSTEFSSVLVISS